MASPPEQPDFSDEGIPMDTSAAGLDALYGESSGFAIIRDLTLDNHPPEVNDCWHGLIVPLRRAGNEYGQLPGIFPLDVLQSIFKSDTSEEVKDYWRNFFSHLLPTTCITLPPECVITHRYN